LFYPAAGRFFEIKRLVPGFAAPIPFSRGAEEIIAWYDADPERQTIDEDHNRLADKMIVAYESMWPKV
jgi:hypothetical protein